MSSDSDQDEFFDAEDSTPFQSLLAVPSPRYSASSETLSDFEEEEKRILELKKRAEERRKKEDEDLERRLSILRKKKAAEFEDTVESVCEDEIRRRKLFEMRQLIGTESTPVKTTETSISVEESTDDSSISENRNDCNTPGTKSHTIEKMENNWGDCDEYLLRLRRKRSGSFGDLPRDTSQLVLDTSSVCEVSRGNIETNISEFHPEKGKLDKSLSFDLDNISTSAEVVVDDIIKEEQIASNEPDIVQSTKTRTPPTSFIKPVAPPRRKRRSNDDSDSISSMSEIMNPGLPPPTPSTSTKQSHDPAASLDIDSVIGGTRHITSQEAELDAKHLDADVDSLDMHIFSFEEVTDDELLGGSDTESGRKKSLRPTMRPKKKSVDQSLSPSTSTCRPRSNSGRSLTDQEILDSVMILDLDTGDKIPLSVAEEKIPATLNPLALHIMKLAKEFQTDNQSIVTGMESDEEDTRSEKGTLGTSGLKAKAKAIKLKKFLGRKMGRTVKKVKSAADTVLHGEEQSIEKEVSFDGKIFKIKSSGNNKGPHDFTQLQMLQDMSGEHVGAIWTMKFSPCGRLLATGGQDSVLRIWVLKSAYSHFDDLRQKYSDVKVSPAQSHESLNSTTSDASFKETNGACFEPENTNAPFKKKPFCSYRGHSADLLDISWSKNYFILSSSMDKTVRLWHISRRECLCTFQHIDFVTAIVFHPKDDRYFLSGSLDGKLRLWNIPDKKVTLWSEVRGSSNLITTANFCQNGKFAVVGTYDGKCIFYNTEQLKYFTQIHVRSTRGKNAKGRKITGIESLQTEDKLLVTSNDSRIRMYDLRDLTLSCKYKGSTNNSSQIKANLSPTEKYIVCGSEDHFIYIWKVHHDYTKFSSARRDRNDYWEAIKVHNAVVTAAIFVPNPALFYKSEDKSDQTAGLSGGEQGEIIISADFTGAIKVIANKPRS
ncbi:hypothetical protein SNE40_000691 [Patella caerulea]|uniref:WD repeat-containing protein 44 n=1 Tax=Patella caerulea TaxID=87958 RepID=A0AAN8KB12_PATCE